MVRQTPCLDIINKLIRTTLQEHVTERRLSFQGMLFPLRQDKLKDTAVIPHQLSSQANLTHLQAAQH